MSHKSNGVSAINSVVALETPGTLESIPITEILAEFICSAGAHPDQILNEILVKKLKESILDYLGVSIAGVSLSGSSEPIYSSICRYVDSISLAIGDTKQQNGSSSGKQEGCSVFTKSRRFPAPFAAFLNGTFAHTLDFDDTNIISTIHPSAPVLPAVLAQAQLDAQAQTDQSGESTLQSTQRLLAAIAVGYEVTIRLGRALGTAAYTRGFHNTATCGIFGAIAALSVLKSLSKSVIVNAFGIAISHTGGSIQFVENGSWNKRMHPGQAAHNAFLCVALAEGGVLGSAKPIEGKFGLVHNFSEKGVYGIREDADLKPIITGLGTEWLLMTTSCKPWPSCRMTHCGHELAEKVRQDAKSRGSDVLASLKSITAYKCEAATILVGAPTQNKIHPKNIVDAQFSYYFQVAVSLLHGNKLGWSIYDYLGDKDVASVSERIKIVKEPSLKSVEDRWEVEWKNGDRQEEFLQEPLGEPSNPFTIDKVREKFMGCAQPVYGEKRTLKICDMVENVEKHGLSALMEMVEAA